jgi:transposase
MPRMVSRKLPTVKCVLKRMLKKTNDKRLAIRIRIVILDLSGLTRSRIASTVGASVSTVDRVRERFKKDRFEGLVDRREANGEDKLSDEFLSELHRIVYLTPEDFGYRRPTWTRELLVLVMKKLTGIKIHPATMSRALKLIGARRGRPRPTVGCPWSDAAKARRIAAINRMRARCHRHDVVVYEDEVDIHLNPKIGLDWMNRGHQKEVLTPGQNAKRYLAGAYEPATGRLIVVEGDRKNGDLFLRLLESLVKKYPKAKTIHVILDNYRIHSSRLVEAALLHRLTRIRLHFLPPYCPNHNKIERIWKDLHDEVTRNHRHRTMDSLMKAVHDFIRDRNQTTQIPRKHRAAA